ncbi:chorismate--pyruvate lyase family protein [Shewanella dokdonensis]|uniref:Probable chorismate pyruvate-lyase n=1 Tax=Shewanella dokdonensis TaxID=712036 RepID=A0ABX8DIW2_9GAMM|nr:chorismate lyase [Shewanella dokdonensis]MCL1075630.1 chorismate lyase [Shewanella dokdonensis]QVK24630.1 chorismate lyase [Shewanella dokdonensis]
MNLTSPGFPFGDIIQWLAEPPRSCLTPALTTWLTADGSLTQRLRQCCQQFDVTLLGETISAPLPGEWPGTAERLWIREVLLCLDNLPLVYARTLAPPSLTQLQHRGQKPLGELLFTDKNFIPGHMEWGQAPTTGNIQQLANTLGQAATAIWGRRRYFQHQQQQLLVAEFFLPEALNRLPPL